jgi:hypothetical protein
MTIGSQFKIMSCLVLIVAELQSSCRIASIKMVDRVDPSLGSIENLSDEYKLSGRHELEA